MEQSCGQSGCHAELIPLVQNSRINTLDGMLSGTRRVFGENPKKQSHPDLSQRLNEKGVDSYLRKLCVSCHLGSDRKIISKFCRTAEAAVLPVICRLIRISSHPALSVRVDNDRFFVCHIRSGSISMNYVGLVETEK